MHSQNVHSLCLFALHKTAKDLDNVGLLVARTYGVAQISTSLPWFLLRDTRDATVHITLMMSYVVVSLCL